MKCVYLFEFCPCVHESAYQTISVHETEGGANEAMEIHRRRDRRRDRLGHEQKDWRVRAEDVRP
jgi:hypothetical protein